MALGGKTQLIGNFSIRCLGVAQNLQAGTDLLLHDIVHQWDSLLLHKKLGEVVAGDSQFVRQLCNCDLLMKPLCHFFFAAGHQCVLLHPVNVVSHQGSIVYLCLTRQSNHLIRMQQLFHLQHIGVGQGIGNLRRNTACNGRAAG